MAKKKKKDDKVPSDAAENGADAGPPQKIDRKSVV